MGRLPVLSLFPLLWGVAPGVMAQPVLLPNCVALAPTSLAQAVETVPFGSGGQNGQAGGTGKMARTPII